MTPDMEEVVERLRRYAEKPNCILVTAADIDRHKSDLLALLSERRKMVEALDGICEMQRRLYGDATATHMALSDLCAALSGSADSGR